jgi:Holliday junction resolvase-like predicted endonuclease
MNVKHKKGIVAECYAKAWLLENFNCMVYTPENGLGPIDIIARYKNGSVRYFDVKSVSRRKDKSLINRGSKDKKIEIIYVNLKTKEVRIKKNGNNSKV